MNSKRSMPSHKTIQSAGVDQETAAEYIRETFEPGDRLATVILNKRTQEVTQRIAAAEKIAAPDFQAWLRFQNAQGCEIYISMNVLSKAAHGRTKADVETIRHIYLDFDENGTAAVEKLLAREDLPKPNHLINTSPDKWQVVWKVQGFGKEQAERLQRSLVRDQGADPAATDCSRVLRLPGFYNHKYSRPFWIAGQTCSKETYGPERFPQAPPDERIARALTAENGRASDKRSPSGRNSQSERDWAYAKRALARGESEEMVVAAIASHRRYDKSNPRYYAELTVSKASQSLRTEMARPGTLPGEPDR